MIRKNCVYAVMASMLFVGSVFAINQIAESSQGSTSDSIYLNENFEFSTKTVKMKNIGDTVVLSATVNSDASVKSLTFSSSHPQYISVTKINKQSARIEKLRNFEGEVIITAKSDDPFVNQEASCRVRCYNTVTLLEDMSPTYIQDDNNVKYSALSSENSNELFLKTGLTYKIRFAVETMFSTKDEPYSDGTYSKIEDEDMDTIQNAIQNMFKDNSISEFQQSENDGSNQNIITFILHYTTSIFTDSSTITGQIICGNEQTTWALHEYKAVSNVSLPNNDVIVI